MPFKRECLYQFKSLSKLLVSLLPLMCCTYSSGANADSEDELDLVRELYGGEEFVSIATGDDQRVDLAPSVTSVINAAQIERMGATDIDQILETIPGLHVSVQSGGYRPIYQFRGISSEYNPQVLMLVNGIPITHVFAGDRGQVWAGMPVKNIARVEVIRGPGSALYGADAYAGVINVITKTASDYENAESKYGDLQVGGRYGTYGRGDGWILYGKKWSNFELAFAAEVHNTDGADEQVTADAQSAIDSQISALNPFYTPVSLAPGSVNLEKETVDVHLDLATQNWRLRLGYQAGNDGGTGAGVAQALDPKGRGDSDRFNVDLTYDNDRFSEDWGVKVQASFYDTSNRSNLVLFPAGSIFPGGYFADGVYASPDVSERHYRLSTSGTYSGFDQHRILVGAGMRYEDMYKVSDTKNYRYDSVIGFVPISAESSYQYPFIREHSRRVYYSYIQDEWKFLPDWTLTAGVRFDNYSDFGSTVNPRAALVWQTTYDLTTKLLYGRAFRAPSFQEQYNLNNPIAQGNSSLDPETINSVELVFDYNWSRNTKTTLNLFWYEMDEIVRFIPDSSASTNLLIAENTGKQEGHGLEFEVSFNPFNNLFLYGNYAYQHSRDKQTNEDVGFAPTHQVFGRLDWRFLQDWNFQVQTNWVTGRKRSANDTRSDVDDYVTVDLTLLGTGMADHWGTTLSVKNLFDSQLLEPSAASALIPGDLPLSGQSLYLELRFQLD